MNMLHVKISWTPSLDDLNVCIVFYDPTTMCRYIYIYIRCNTVTSGHSLVDAGTGPGQTGGPKSMQTARLDTGCGFHQGLIWILYQVLNKWSSLTGMSCAGQGPVFFSDIEFKIILKLCLHQYTYSGVKSK